MTGKLYDISMYVRVMSVKYEDQNVTDNIDNIIGQFRKL